MIFGSIMRKCFKIQVFCILLKGEKKKGSLGEIMKDH